MKRFIEEDWIFQFTVTGGETKKDGALNCRCGFETGDRFECEYACPADFCPKMLMKSFSLMEAVRSGGSLALLGGDTAHSMEIICPDGMVRFRIEARPKEQTL